MLQQLSRFAVLIAFAGITGCGGGPGGDNKPVTISGKVTVAGKGPLAGGTIQFVDSSAPDKKLTAPIGADGRYQVLNAQLGDYKVTVDNTAIKASKPPSGGEVPGMPMPKYMPIDRKYAQPKTSGLSTKVSGNAHTYDIELN